MTIPADLGEVIARLRAGEKPLALAHEAGVSADWIYKAAQLHCRLTGEALPRPERRPLGRPHRDRREDLRQDTRLSALIDLYPSMERGHLGWWLAEYGLRAADFYRAARLREAETGRAILRRRGPRRQGEAKRRQA
jgi:hypothetical protein